MHSILCLLGSTILAILQICWFDSTKVCKLWKGKNLCFAFRAGKIEILHQKARRHEVHKMCEQRRETRNFFKLHMWSHASFLLIFNWKNQGKMKELHHFKDQFKCNLETPLIVLSWFRSLKLHKTSHSQVKKLAAKKHCFAHVFFKICYPSSK